jgi:branched-chain amino acid transport system substrate-binding protein
LGKTNYFMLGATNPVSSAGGMIAAKANGATSIGLAYCAEVPACAQAQQLYGALAPQIPGGVTFAAGVPASATQPNYTAECLQLIDKKADWVQLGVSIGVGVKIANECQKQGYKGAFGASNQTLVAKPVETITPAVKFGGSITFFPWFAKSGPAKTFQDVMAKYAAGKDVGSVAATTMWTSLELFRKTMKTAPATSADVLKAYQGVTNETLDGLLPSPVSFSASKPSQPISCFWSVKWDGKAWSTITPTGDLAALATGNNGQTGDLASMCFTPKLG